MTTLAASLSFSRSSTMRVGDNFQSLKSLCFTPFAKVWKQLLQEVLDLQKLLSLPNMLRMDIAIAHGVLTRLVNGTDANQSMKSLNNVAVYRTERQAHDTSILSNMDAALPLEEPSYPTQIYSFHRHYDRALARIVATALAVTRAKLTLDLGTLSWINDYVAVAA